MYGLDPDTSVLHRAGRAWLDENKTGGEPAEVESSLPKVLTLMMGGASG